MELELKITCTCHQAKIAICCQTPLVAPIASKICTEGFLNMLNPNLPSDLLSDHSSNTSFKRSFFLCLCCARNATLSNCTAPDLHIFFLLC